MNNFLIVLLGPTGVGKTDISIDLAEKFNCEIISADSRQFFREMKIGTAVPSDDQLNKIKHHFIRFLSLQRIIIVQVFLKEMFLLFFLNYFQKTTLCLLTGGSGLYIDAVCNGYDDIPDVDPVVKRKIYCNVSRMKVLKV